MVLLFTGNGKGKTTAAIGQAIRALGQGKRVAMLQFIKGKGCPSGEDSVLPRLGKKLLFAKGGRGFVGIMGDELPRAVHRRAARATLARALSTVRSKRYNLVILDEVNVALHLGLIALRDVLRLIREVPRGVDVILTGRYAPKTITRYADLVTHFEDVKHPFHRRAPARRGIEH